MDLNILCLFVFWICGLFKKLFGIIVEKLFERKKGIKIFKGWFEIL